MSLRLAGDLPGLAASLASGELPLGEMLAALERRFAEREPELAAFVPEEGRFARLARQAAELEERWPDPSSRPPLFGVPVGVKDVLHVDGLPTRGGSRLPPEELAGPEAAAVGALRRAGALVAGKTVTTEFAWFAPGPTRHPHAPDHTPGGSSSGSAAAVAAGLVPLALGTQTIASVDRPAAFCGVVGFKATYDRIPRDGLIPLAPSLDHVGLFTRTAAGAALAASVLVDGWRGEAARAPRRRPVLALPRGPYLGRASDAARRSFFRTVERLGAAGWAVRDVDAFADLGEIEARHDEILAAEAARVHAGWFSRFAELFRPRTAALVERGRTVSDERLADLLAQRTRLGPELDARLEAAGADLWISPAATGPAPRGRASTGDPAMGRPWTHAGVPLVALPAGTVGGLPVGVRLAGRTDGDEELLAAAAAVEEALAR